MSTDENKAKRCIEHNLGQAKGWLQEWRAGRNLIGKNKYQKFSIVHGDQQHIVILSVVGGFNCLAKYHEEFTKEYKVTCCGTIPQKALEVLIKQGASSIDIIHFLTVMSHTPDYIKESVCIDKVKKNNIDIFQKAEFADRLTINVSYNSYEYFTGLLKAIICNDGSTQSANDNYNLVGRLSDLPLEDRWAFTTKFIEQKENSKVSRKSLCSRFKLPISGICVALVTGSLEDVVSNATEYDWVNELIEGAVPSFTFTWLFSKYGLEHKHFTTDRITDDSYTKKYLDQFLNKSLTA